MLVLTLKDLLKNYNQNIFCVHIKICIENLFLYFEIC